MNIREAILKAADHIEANPDEFNYWKSQIPCGPHCGSPGCALGWIGAFAGAAKGSFANDVAREVLGTSDLRFYLALSDLLRDSGEQRSWQKDGPLCARALRLYADKHHPAEVVEVSKVVRPEAGSWDLIPWQPKKVRGFTTIEFLIAVAAVGALGLTGCLVWAGVHFLAKLW